MTANKKKKRIGNDIFYRVLNIFVTTIAVLAIVVAIAAIWAVVTTEEGDAPQLAGYSIMRVVTGSMEPEIPEGSVIIAKEMPLDEIKDGDVISFYSQDPNLSGALNTHRVVEKQKYEGDTYFITKGDANAFQDAYSVRGEDVVGKVVFNSEKLGTVVGFASNTFGFILLILVPLLLIFLINLKDVIKLAKQAYKESMEDIDEEKEHEK